MIYTHFLPIRLQVILQIEFSDKCGKPLACFLHPKQTSSCIPHLQGPNGEITSPSSVMEMFHDFYQSLYNVSPQQSVNPTMIRETRQTDYISDTPLLTLDIDTTINLENLLTEEGPLPTHQQVKFQVLMDSHPNSINIFLRPLFLF